MVQQDEEESKDGELDAEGFLDLLGSGRLKKKVLQEGPEGAQRPRKGEEVKVLVTGG